MILDYLSTKAMMKRNIIWNAGDLQDSFFLRPLGPGRLVYQYLAAASLVSRDLYYPADGYLLQRASDLLEMERRIRFTPTQNFQQKYFYSQNPNNASISPLAVKIEGLLTQVCLILNTWPRKQGRLRIFLLKDGKQVKQRQLVFQPEERGWSIFGYGSVEAFYEPCTHTIFLSLADLHEGILAHEMAHYVMCEAYSVRPPHEMQEDWARYVENKLY